MNDDSQIYVAGHQGMVGSAIVRKLCQSKTTADRLVTRTSSQLDLTKQSDVMDFFEQERPSHVYVAAAKVGGIHANQKFAGEFIYENLMISANIIHAAYKFDVTKLLFLGSSCIYPRDTVQPMREEAMLSGPLETTNQWYAVAKIAGIKLCQGYRKQYGSNFISVMPTNLYGPGDNFHLENSHVPAALLRRFHEAKMQNRDSVDVWGTGKPRREFLHVDDLAAACVFLMKHYNGSDPINVGTGSDVTINEFAHLIKTVVGFDGGIQFDVSKPDGTPSKALDVSRLSSLGWTSQIPLEVGLKKFYSWFLDNQGNLRR